MSWIVQTAAQDSPAGNSQRNTIHCSGGLGANDLEWLILYGCQAVIVADSDGTTYHPMGVEAFRRTWDGFHIIMGHYISYFTCSLVDLSHFADGLRAGVPVQAAYFLTAPDLNSSAISAEYYAGLAEGVEQADGPENHFDWALLDWFLRNGSIMNTDTWTNPNEDLSREPNIWYTKWIRRDGTTAEAWASAE
jgi:hypothetical protein